MPNTTKNLTATAQGASTSRVNRAKTVSKSRQTKADILKQLNDERRKLREAEAARRELVSKISEKNTAIEALKHSSELWQSMWRLSHACVDSLITSLRAMNDHCETLRKSRS